MTIIAAVAGIDESDSVVQRGYELATAFDEELVVLHVEPETEELEDAGLRHGRWPPEVWCNDCEFEDREPRVIERIEGSYVSYQHPRPLLSSAQARRQLNLPSIP